MKAQQPPHLSRLARIILNVICRYPELAQPNVQQKVGEKASQIENILFHRNRSAKCKCLKAKGRTLVGVAEKPPSEEQIERKSQRNQNRDGAPESALRNVQSLAGQQPSRDQCEGNNE